MRRESNAFRIAELITWAGFVVVAVVSVVVFSFKTFETQDASAMKLGYQAQSIQKLEADQKEVKKDLIDRLDRIEAKVDSLLKEELEK